MDSLPDEIVNKIKLYNSNPCSDKLKEIWLIEKYTKQYWCNNARIVSKCRIMDDERKQRWACSMGWQIWGVTLTIGYMKHKCKQNGIKGYSKLKKKKEVAKLLMSI